MLTVSYVGQVASKASYLPSLEVLKRLFAQRGRA